MTTRDRLALIAISSLALLAVVWLLVVSPERKQAAELDKQVSAANAQLAGAEAEAANARAAQAHYADAYASVVDLGKAVPPSEEVPSLIYQLAQASNQKHLEFSSITTGTSGASTSSAPTTTASAGAPTGFTQMPFTFVFDGSFDDLYHLFLQLDHSTVNTSSGLQVSGRLLTLQGVKLEPKETNGSSAALSGTITATAYVLPAAQGLTGGATAAAPASSSAATTASSAASSTSSSAPPAAVVTAGGVR
jgi:Tfp pilus assembly protein PilO